VRESQLEDSGSGLTPVTEGWFVVNLRDAEWLFSEKRGARCAFESEYGDPPVEFDQFGINVTVLEPGQTGLYHAEANQEAFLVLSGECALLVEGEERRLGPGTSSTLRRGPSTPSWASARGRV
jgi:quercetin dioxygenase-like cupin family protein